MMGFYVVLISDAIIITGGTNCGVMKYVGEAVKEYELSSKTAERRGEKEKKKERVNTLGIATWSMIRTDMKNELSNAIDKKQVTYYFDIMN